MCAEGGGGGGKGMKKRKENEKMGIKIVFFFCFFLSPRAGIFICAVVIFQIYKENCI